MDGKCIFEYKSVPTYGRVGMPGALSVRVLDSGAVVRTEYVIGRDAPREETVLATIPELAREIEGIIARRAEELAAMPDTLHNGSYDGALQVFRFGGKRISALNISRCDPEEVRKRNPRYYERFRENMERENLVLDIYNEIASAINRFDAGIRLRIL